MAIVAAIASEGTAMKEVTAKDTVIEDGSNHSTGRAYLVGTSMICLRQWLFLLCTALFLSAVPVFLCSVGQAAENQAGGERALLDKYPVVRAKLEKNQFGAPIYLESAEVEDSLRVEMYGIFNYPFDAVRDALQSPADWCDITSMHINIKACTSRKAADQWLLTLYSGPKHYRAPADAYPLAMKFRIVSQQPEYLAVALTADEGPLHTRDHRIRLEAAPLESGKTFVHFSYAYRHDKIARMVIKTYFATLARDKVGFSVVAGTAGNPVYISGVRGAIERNAVRYYLAVETYLDTVNYPEGQRFEQRISRWYDLTARYSRQLKEIGKDEYIASKRHEHINQILQQKKDGR